MRAGHMPGAFNLPFGIELHHSFMGLVDGLRRIFSNLIGNRRKLIFTCGSGLTACICAFAAHLAGYYDISIYDRSWCERGGGQDLLVATT
jgi:thiosulfate/3-mercaptopyruvate sulfurtransferase